MLFVSNKVAAYGMNSSNNNKKNEGTKEARKRS